MPDKRGPALSAAIAGRPFVVAGSGPSLASFDRRRVGADDVIVRVNNFFFEENFELGRRVDLLQVGGDRWVFPFFAATVRKILAEQAYAISAWSSHQPHVIRRGRHALPLPFVPITYRSDRIRREIEALMGAHDKVPTTGIRAVINAHGLGASSITLVGIDLYASDDRYGYNHKGHSADLLNELDHMGYNERFHSLELDRAILKYLAEQGEVDIFRASSASGMLDFLDLAPIRKHPISSHPKSDRQQDWVRWAGIWPIEGMRLARGLHRMQKTIFERKKR